MIQGNVYVSMYGNNFVLLQLSVTRSKARTLKFDLFD
jgi:hypothetical protein